MGSLGSRPEIPAAQPQVIYYTPVSPTTTTPTTGDSGSGSGEGSLSGAQSSSDARTTNLLQRNRGIFGTVQTSFRGLLGLAGGAGSGRKTLLGE